MWDSAVTDEPGKKKEYRGVARDLGMTYFNTTGGKMPEWMRKGKTPPKDAYPEHD